MINLFNLFNFIYLFNLSQVQESGTELGRVVNVAPGPVGGSGGQQGLGSHVASSMLQ